MISEAQEQEKGARRGRRPEKPPALPNLARKLNVVTRHALPELGKWLGGVADPRDTTRCYYPIQKLLWTGIVSYLCGARSRRDFRMTSDSPAFVANMNLLADTVQDTVPHPDSLAYLVERLPAEELAGVLTRCVRTLIRSRVLDDSRLRGYYLVAIDGTELFSSRRRHCPLCLTRTHGNGTTTYYHSALEAKLVTPGALALSIDTEFIENATPNASKQDCELMAFYRLLPRLHDRFPRTRICLLLDGIYANDTVLKLCENYGWKYVITFKQGSLPTVWDDYQILQHLQPDHRLVLKRGEEPQEITWVNRMTWKLHRFDALTCAIRGPDGATTRFSWLTNFELNRHNVEAIANDGGRCRWKIENQGFNVQKNGAFHIEHPFGRQAEAWKNYYLLAQMAHILLQLMYWWRALRVVRTYLGAVYRFIARLAQDMRAIMPCAGDLIEPAFQLRLDTS